MFRFTPGRITERYAEITLRAQKTGKCYCGKRLKRSTTFSQTLSPFNRKDDRLKTEPEIREELRRERDQCLTETPTHPRIEWGKLPRHEHDRRKLDPIKYDWPLVCGYRESGARHDIAQ